MVYHRAPGSIFMGSRHPLAVCFAPNWIRYVFIGLSGIFLPLSDSASMYLKNIYINHFCNLEEQELEFHPELNVFVGNNGMGKTNMLDAIHFLALTRSNFSRLDTFSVRHGESFARLSGQFLVKEKPHQIVVKLNLIGRKQVEKNGKAYDTLSEHIGQYPLVMIAPKDNVQILESSAERRKLLDRIIAQTNQGYLQDLIRYNKLLDQRNALLKSDSPQSVKRDMLMTYSERMTPPAINLYEERMLFIESLEPVFSDWYSRIAGNAEQASLFYQSQLADNEFMELAKENLEKDLILKRSSTGIHKDDIRFSLNDTDISHFASQGQLKSLVLAFKLAQFEYLKRNTATTPVILLDDVFDKLDRIRVKQLVDLLFEEKLGQVFISDTDYQRIQHTFAASAFSYKVFMLENGKVIESETVVPAN